VPPLPRLLPATLLLAALGGCGGGGEPPPRDPAPEGVQDLLLRPATSEVHTDAVVAPTTEVNLGDHDLGGWQLDADTQVFPRRTFALTSGAEAALLLSATGPAQREVSLTVWAEQGSGSLAVSLNGVDLGEHELGGSARTISVQPPPSAWLVGGNELCLALVGDGLATLALEAVRVEPAERITSSADGSLLLDPGTAASWTVEHAGPCILDLELRTAVAGTAVVTLERLWPERGPEDRPGATRPPGPLEQRHVIVPAGEATAVRLHLVASDRCPTKVSLAWQGGGAPLALSKLQLHEDQPLARPPILFLSVDTLAAQNLSLLGYDRATTPNLERFATDAVTFEAARSNAPWTVPSYASQFTGLYANSNKLSPNKSIPEDQREAGWRYYELVEERWTLTEALAAAGYRTSAFVDNLWLTRLPGFRQGFESFDGEAARRSHEDQDGGMRYVLPRALEVLREDDPRPPFVFAHVFDVHGPYWPGDGFRGRFARDLAVTSSLPVADTGKTLFGVIPTAIARGRVERGPLPGVMAPEPLRADYDEKILELDAELGGFFDELREAGLYDELLIVVSADHGESMVDHDYHFSHGLVYDSTIHVPLLIKLPHQAFGGTRVDEPVQLVDLYPTLLDLLGLGRRPLELHGRSLVPALEGRALVPKPLLAQADVMDQCALVAGRWKLVVSLPENTDLDVLFSNPTIQARLFATAPDLFQDTFGQAPPLAPNDVPPALAALLRDDPSLHWRAKRLVQLGGPIFELYDVEADPAELVDLSGTRRDIVDELLPLLAAQRDRAEAARSNEAPAELRLPDDVLEELRRLGYLGDE